MNDHLPSIEDFLTRKVKTLGWGVLSWCSKYIAQPDGKYKGDPWVFYPEQALFILRWYAVNDEGEFIYTRGIFERPKGYGKSPMLAAMCCAELLGPVRFSYWDKNGEPVGRPEYTPLIQIAAISEDQANNTYNLVMDMLAEGLAYSEYDLEGCIMLSKVHTNFGGIIQKVTSSPRGREGQRVTFVVCDETHLWVPAEKGPELFDALRRNSVKMDTRMIETTNAPVPGEGSVAEDSHNAVQQQLKELNWTNILLDTREVFVEDIYDKAQAMPALEYVYGDAAKTRGGHVNLERVFYDICDPSTKEHVARRFYFNQRRNDGTAWIGKAKWEGCKDSRIKLRRDDLIALGFKGTKYSSALLACRLTDGALFVLGHWERTVEPEWDVPVGEIDRLVRRTLEEGDVALAFCEPERWQDIVARWHADYEVVEEFWWSNKQKIVRATEQFESAVYEHRLKHFDERLDRHVYNAQIQEYPQGYTIRKETKSSSNHIALAQAAILAFTAASQAIEEGALRYRDKRLYTW